MDSRSVEGRVEAIVRSLEAQGRPAAPIQEATDLALSHPESVADLARATIRRFPEGGTFLDAALSYLPEDHWDSLVRFALDALEGPGENEAACSIIAYASLQALPSLHPHLDRIFKLRPNSGTYYEDYPWRESGTSHFGSLREEIEGQGSDAVLRHKAWRAMLQTRHPEVLEYALAHAESAHEPSPGLSVPETVQAHLHLVGYHRDDRSLRAGISAMGSRDKLAPDEVSRQRCATEIAPQGGPKGLCLGLVCFPARWQAAVDRA